MDATLSLLTKILLLCGTGLLVVGVIHAIWMSKTIASNVFTVGAVIFLFLGGALYLFVAYQKSPQAHLPIIFSEKAIIGSLWREYKKEYVEAGSNRTIDREHKNVTTSEGQSYTMLRAVWMDDMDTFDKSWAWTQEFLGRSSDHLFSWQYGERPDHTYGILAGGGMNTASDADTDIALSLLFAYARWGDEKYLVEVRPIISDIWDKEILVIQGKPYLMANNVEKLYSNKTALMNPSYFSPYAYRIFALVDTAHPWSKLVDTSYDVLRTSTISSLDKNRSVFLPPDWVRIDKITGAIVPAASSDLSTNYGYDAMRIPFRLAFDWQWYKDPHDVEILKTFEFLSTQWKDNGKLYSSYTHDGQVVFPVESAAMYGGSLGYFLLNDQAVAKQIYQTKLVGLYNPDTETWKNPMGYYDSNLAWFGIALYNHSLPNLIELVSGKNHVEVSD